MSEDVDQHSREIVLTTLFIGTVALITTAFIVVCFNYLFLNLHYLAPRIGIIGILGLTMMTLYSRRKQYYRIASYGLIIFYFIAAAITVWLWGGEVPIGILLFALTIVFSGILLNARSSLYVFSLIALTISTFAWLNGSGLMHPSVLKNSQSFPDVAVYVIILGNLALVSWLFNRSMNRSLFRALRSERALRRQKKLLELKVEKRVRQIQVAQLERVQEMYQFSELGHMSVSLLHDVANYLSILSLDVEDLKEARKNRTIVIRRVQGGIRHLNSLTNQVRKQIEGQASLTRFNIVDEINQTATLLGYKAKARHVTIQKVNVVNHQKIWLNGSITHFRHIVTNLISNAIDAYSEVLAKQSRVVIVTVEQTQTDIKLIVTDHGSGISRSILKKIFEPFYTSKKDGMGMGLAITKRMVEKDFGGTIQVTSNAHYGTSFTVTFPLA